MQNQRLQNQIEELLRKQGLDGAAITIEILAKECQKMSQEERHNSEYWLDIAESLEGICEGYDKNQVFRG